MGKIIRKKIEYTGGSGDGSGKVWSGTDGIDVDNNTNTISANSTLARTSQVPTKVSELPNDAGYQNASEVDSKINSAVSSVYTYKGTVANQSALPNNASTGDVYNVADDGLNYAYNGTAWTPLAGTFDTSGLIENPANKTAGQILEYNGTQWVASNPREESYNIPVTNGRITATFAELKAAREARKQFYCVGYGGNVFSVQQVSLETINGEEQITVYINTYTGDVRKIVIKSDDTQTSEVVQTLEDTGWQTITGEYIDFKYRKKNGVVYITFSGCVFKKELPVGSNLLLGTLPDGCAPSEHVTAHLMNRSGQICGFLIARPTSGRIEATTHTAIAVSSISTIITNFSFPVG